MLQVLVHIHSFWASAGALLGNWGGGLGGAICNRANGIVDRFWPRFVRTDGNSSAFLSSPLPKNESEIGFCPGNQRRRRVPWRWVINAFEVFFVLSAALELRRKVLLPGQTFAGSPSNHRLFFSAPCQRNKACLETQLGQLGRRVVASRESVSPWFRLDRFRAQKRVYLVSRLSAGANSFQILP